MVTLKKNQLAPIKNPVDRADEFGNALHNALESVGIKFGIYQTMLQTGPLTPACLATQIGITEMNARIWLDAQFAGACLKSSPSTDLYRI